MAMAEWLLSIERCLIPYELLAHHSNVANFIVCSGDESCFDLICGNFPQGIPATCNAIRLHLFYRSKIKSQNTSYILETRQSQAKTVVKVEEMF